MNRKKKDESELLKHVSQDVENPEPFELIAKSIIEVADGFEKLKKSKLKKRAVILLLHDSIGSGNITKGQIEKVLDHAPKLKSLFLED